ncbi:hypothetical protein MTR67_043866 [Solanum verrucosum]|uniref:Amine oxidase domain-containing protein n=1 Tax=Solanum verrucosum TaxID=315347 RepID=A0AAF0US85_SOLVR|nr:hypothetical protein MTR67_043866 [Solanum verrucosum]
MEGVNKVAAADLGRSVLTGTLENPHGLLARQLSYTLHKVSDQCPLYRAGGKLVDEHLDKKVEDAYNGLLKKASKLRQELSQIVPLGWALETLQKDFGVAMNDKEMSLFNWHLENLEFTNAGLLSQLSLAFWDQDNRYDMGGDHFFFPSGNERLVHAMAENVPIIFKKIINCGGKEDFFFAGEATTGRYPATMHGAFLTGLREAAKMAHNANVRTLHLQVKK